MSQLKVFTSFDIHIPFFQFNVNDYNGQQTAHGTRGRIQNEGVQHFSTAAAVTTLSLNEYPPETKKDKVTTRGRTETPQRSKLWQQTDESLERPLPRVAPPRGQQSVACNIH